jgi:hypothetical protein
MPLFFLLAGLILIVTGINGTTATAGDLLKRDFTGPNNFFTWFFAILFVGALGYIPTLKPLSIAFLVLLFVSIFLTSGSGFFDKLAGVMRKFQGQTSNESFDIGNLFDNTNLGTFDLSLPDLTLSLNTSHSL